MTIASAAKRKQARTEPTPPAPVAAAPPADAGRFEPALPLDSIAPSPHNPRKTFDEAELSKLADSIRGPKGVLQPIVVRPRKWSEATPFKELDCPAAVTRRLEMLLETAVGVGLRSVTTVEALLAHLDAKGGARGVELRRIGLPDNDADLVVEALHTFEEGTRAKLGYELVCGERRWRASKLAGRDTIPALVRDLDDKAAAELSVVENDQREDVPPLEQARGYRRLLDLGDDAAGVAAKIGRSEDYVLERLQLTKLIPALQEDLAKGYITFTHARTLAKVERPEDQAELRKNHLYGWPHPDTFDAEDLAAGERPAAVPVHRLREEIADAFRRDLSAAPWKLDDAGLLPAAGACTACPKRSGNRPGLFDELLGDAGKKKADQCFDRGCYDQKQAAVVDLGLRKAAEKAGGGEVLRVSTEFYSRRKGVLPADKYEVVGPKEATGAKAGELRQAVVADGRGVGKVLTVRVKKEKKAPGSKPGKDNYQERWKKGQEAREEQRVIGTAAARHALQAVADKTAAVFADVELPAAAVAILRQVAVAMPAISRGAGGVCERRGLAPNKRRGHRPDGAAVEDLAGQLSTPGELVALIAELAAAEQSHRWLWERSKETPGERAFWQAFGVDRTKLLKQAADEQKRRVAEALKKPAAKPAAKPSANGHARPKAKAKRARAAAATDDAGDEDDGSGIADVPFAGPGDVVRTSYGTGPYRVETIVAAGRRDGRRTYSLRLTAIHGKKEKGASLLNHFQRDADGVITAANGDELVVLGPDADPGPSYHDWLKAAGIDDDEDDRTPLQRRWMLGEPPPELRSVPSPAKWRSLPVEDLNPSGVAVARLHLKDVTTCGELADALDMADTLGLDPPDLRAMQRAIDGLRADDDEPHPTLCPPRACRVCGCTDEDCSGCVEKTGAPCSWVEFDLCSACVGVPADGRDGPPPLKGESIDQLDVSADTLDAAHLALAFKDKTRLSKALPVKQVTLNGRPHVVTASLEGWVTGARSWEVRPLYTRDDYIARFGVDRPCRFLPDRPPCDDPWDGVRVIANLGGYHDRPTEFVIGPKGEQRRLVEPPKADPKKAKKARRQEAVAP